MFVKGEDFYFLSYNIFLLLLTYESTNEKSRFRDYRKLAFLIDFISDSRLSRLLDNPTTHYNIADKDFLNRSYANGLLRMNEILKLLFALEKHKIITLLKDNDSNSLDVYLNTEELARSFWDWELFLNEKQNLSRLKTNIPKLKSLKLETLLSKLYYNYSDKQWDIF